MWVMACKNPIIGVMDYIVLDSSGGGMVDSMNPVACTANVVNKIACYVIVIELCSRMLIYSYTATATAIAP